MCGISAIINNKDCESVNKQILKHISHRGDCALTYDILNNNNSLGSVRLKIIDRTHGSMPIYNEDKTLAIVLNGEIYNYKYLKKSLIEKGHNFKTNTDTEVIVHLYEEYGNHMFSKLDGMFALIIYSIIDDSCVAARDRWGIKPLYYSIFQESVYFSSELKGFSSLSFLNKIEELKPGCYLLDGKQVPYYKQSFEINKISYDLARIKVRELLEKATKRRVDTDLPIGVFLSGGVDSSIVFLLARNYHSNVTPIIIGTDDSSDVITAKKLCEIVDSDFIHINISKEVYLENIPNVIAVIETFEPNPVRGSALSYYLAKAAMDNGFKIVLCGEGGDEVFGGYRDFIGLDSNEFQDVTQKFIGDLYRTQLLRIDRTGMAFGVEVREPFMDNILVDFGVKLPPEYKIMKSNNRILTKYILRDAFVDLLPDFIFSRDKKTLMEGAGASSVQLGEGVFYQNANSKLSDEKFDAIVTNYKEYSFKNKEDAFYFDIYVSKYGLKADFAINRTFNALQEIV